MAVTTDFVQAQSFLTQNETAAKVFRFILQKTTAPGWRIVKELGADTDQTEVSLNQMRSLGLLESDKDGLDGFYHSTSLGYALREALSLY